MTEHKHWIIIPREDLKDFLETDACSQGRTYECYYCDEKIGIEVVSE